jgi:hypothetical protein
MNKNNKKLIPSADGRLLEKTCNSQVTNDRYCVKQPQADKSAGRPHYISILLEI